MSEKINKELRKKMKGLIPTQAFIGKVLKVTEGSKYTCNVMPIDSEAEIFSVRLKPTIDGTKKGIIAIPTVGSFVIVGLINNNENSAFIIWCSNIKKYFIIDDNNNIIEFTNADIQLNGSHHNGLVKVKELTDKLNELEKTVNTLISTYNGHTHTGGTIFGSTGPVSVPDTDVLVPTLQAEIENTKVKHGNGSS
jgi:aromatic ring-opening dioxygenase LigB subunit